MGIKLEHTMIEHPMEDIFDLPSGSTALVREVRETTDLVAPLTYDEKDNEIEQQTQEIYDSAMSAFQDQMRQSALVEPKYASRTTEVALQALSIALESVKQKSAVKTQKDKIVIAAQKGPSTVNNNLIVSSRKDLLKNILSNEPESDDES